MRGVALRCAEQGTHLGVSYLESWKPFIIISDHTDAPQLLEQLTGSQSLASEVECIVLHRHCDIIGTIIITLWLLSPLGGQSSL